MDIFGKDRITVNEHTLTADRVLSIRFKSKRYSLSEIQALCNRTRLGKQQSIQRPHSPPVSIFRIGTTNFTYKNNQPTSPTALTKPKHMHFSNT